MDFLPGYLHKKMTLMHDKIIYSIFDDGTCSYCGREADLVELPDGDVTTSDSCDSCDEYNNEMDAGYCWWEEGFDL